MKKSKTSSLTQKAMQALSEAVAKVVQDHRRQNRPLAVWRDGKAVWIPASEAGALRENPAPYRTKDKKV
jgi:hypothetical protein